MSARALCFSVFLILCGILGTSAAARPHHHPHVARHGFDGTYRVEARTIDATGRCLPSYSGTVTIRNFRVVAISDPGATAAGGIEDDGTISLALMKDGEIANIGGRLRGGHAKGTWSSPTAFCGGVWHAEREN